MAKVTFISADGAERTIDVRGGQSLMEAALEHDVEGIEAICGGACSCATCRIFVKEPWAGQLAAPSSLEADLLSAFDDEADVRLSCQVIMTAALDGMVVRTPANQD